MRILAINDVSCVGKCSLTAALPIISACGIECNILPTAILSTHTGGFEGYTFRDCTEDFPAILAHWKSLNLQFDFVVSGYLGSIHQIQMVLQIKKDFLKPDGIFVVDPVMGDSGKLYDGFTDAYVKKMRELCAEADYILPNATEACYLTDLSYPLNNQTALIAFERLKDICKTPIVTGVTNEKNISVYFPDTNGNVCTYAHENIDGMFPGAGDVFTSAFVGALARGKDKKQAVLLATDFANACIRRSTKEVTDKRYGLPFEKEIFPFLQKLNG